MTPILPVFQYLNTLEKTSRKHFKAFLPDPWKDDKPRQCIKKQRHHFADKSLSS